jgi:RNA recognition motif-containing protein
VDKIIQENSSMKIYVGNLPYSIRDEQLEEMFTSFGEVNSASVIIERDTNRSKGFGFVEMNDNTQATTAINELNNKEFEGRGLKVSEARPREDKPRRPRSFNNRY